MYCRVETWNSPQMTVRTLRFKSEKFRVLALMLKNELIKTSPSGLTPHPSAHLRALHLQRDVNNKPTVFCRIPSFSLKKITVKNTKCENLHRDASKLASEDKTHTPRRSPPLQGR